MIAKINRTKNLSLSYHKPLKNDSDIHYDRDQSSSIKGLRWALFIKQNLKFGSVGQFFLAVFTTFLSGI